MNRSPATGAGAFARALRLVAFAGLAAAVLAGCAQTQKVARVDKLSAVGPNPKILLMKPDVTINLMTASGMSEPQAEWTKAARVNFVDAADAYGKTRQVEVVRMSDDTVLTVLGTVGVRILEPLEAYLAVSRMVPTSNALPALPQGDNWELRAVVRTVF